jgi:alpha-galactosidase
MTDISININPEELMDFVIWLDTEIIASQSELPKAHIAWLTKIADAISEGVSELAGYQHVTHERALEL